MLRLVVASSLIGASALQLPAIRAPASCNRATCVRMEDVDLPFDEGEQLEEAEAAAAAAAEAEQFTAAIATAPGRSTWGITQVSPDGSLVQRIEGKTRKTWKFSDFSKDRVQVALTSEGRPVNADVQLWLGPDWTPFTLKAYSEDGKLRPVQTLVGTRNKAAMIEVRNVGEYEFPFSAASNYAQGPMVALASDIPASTPGELVQGGALASFPLEPSAEQLEVVLRTDGKQVKRCGSTSRAASSALGGFAARSTLLSLSDEPSDFDSRRHSSTRGLSCSLAPTTPSRRTRSSPTTASSTRCASPSTRLAR